MVDWDDLRFFLAVARHGTMSAAARALKVAQPTVGRRIGAFEERLGARLFVRSSVGWKLSPAGQGILAHAQEMEARALAAETVAAGRDVGLSGVVRVTASEWMVESVLGPRLGPLLARHPSLAIDLLAEPRHLNLSRREADIAVRPSRFPHLEVFQREAAVVRFGLYASDDYLVRHGMPDFATGSPGHLLVAAGEQMGSSIVDVEWLPALVGKGRVAVRANGRMAMAGIAAAGMGLVCLPCFLGDATSGLRRLSTADPGPRRQLWLGVHRSARAIPRVRAAADFIVEVLSRLRKVLDPGQ
jgi:DNA-binding transcriptional LysR family regulator